MVAGADLVLTAEAAHRTFLLEEHPEAFRKVFSLGQFAEAVAAHGKTTTGRELVETVGRHRSAADPRDDVADPYGRGPDVAAACSARIDGLLAMVVPALLQNRATQ